jgi:hypothetical protein
MGAMTTTPEVPVPDNGEDPTNPPPSEGAPGVEIGMSEDGSTFEPEEDQEDQG